MGVGGWGGGGGGGGGGGEDFQLPVHVSKHSLEVSCR